jgi:hypothetical protein
MEDVNRTPSPPVSTKDSPGQQHDGEESDPTSVDSKKEPGALPSSTTICTRHESVDELVDDCDIPETIVEVPEEDDDDDENVHDIDATNLGTRPVLLQPLLSDDSSERKGLARP